jgi:hypothetical protein
LNDFFSSTLKFGDEKFLTDLKINDQKEFSNVFLQNYLIKINYSHNKKIKNNFF